MTSQFEEFQRTAVNWSSLLYRCANGELVQRLVQLDQNTPCDMQAPAEEGATRSSARWMSCAYAANVDPLELRLINYSDKTRSKTSPIAASSCANAIAGARRSSAGPSATRSRGR